MAVATLLKRRLLAAAIVALQQYFVLAVPLVRAACLAQCIYITNTHTHTHTHIHLADLMLSL